MFTNDTPTITTWVQDIWKGKQLQGPILDKQGLCNLEEGDIGEPYNGPNGPSWLGFDQLGYAENLLCWTFLSLCIIALLYCYLF